MQRKLLRSRRVRVDTTVMEADVRYPTDSGLCAHAVSRISRSVARVKAAGLVTRTRVRNRRRSAGKVVRRVSHALGRAGGKGEVLPCTREQRSAHGVRQLAAEIEQGQRMITQTLRRLGGEARYRIGSSGWPTSMRALSAEARCRPRRSLATRSR